MLKQSMGGTTRLWSGAACRKLLMLEGAHGEVSNQHPPPPPPLGGRKPWCDVPTYLRCAPLSSAPRDGAIAQGFLFG